MTRPTDPCNLCLTIVTRPTHSTKVVLTYNIYALAGNTEALVKAMHEAALDNSTALQPLELPEEVPRTACACARAHFCSALPCALDPKP